MSAPIKRHLGHVICTTCFHLRSIDDPVLQHAPDQCRCSPDPALESGYTNEQLVSCTVCGGCGLAVSSGHTRWRTLHCPPCRERVKVTNVRARQLVIPLGIHSIVNTVPGRRRRPSESQSKTLADELNGMSSAIDRLDDVIRQRVADNLHTTGLDRLELVGFDEYVAACHAAGITADTGWTTLLEALNA